MAKEAFRIEKDSLGEVRVPIDKLWGAQTQRSLEHFNIGPELFSPHMIRAYAMIKKAAALVNHKDGDLDEQKRDLICQVCDEVLAGKHDREFPLHVWMGGSGTQFNMNVNEVIANRSCQIAGLPLGSKTFIHPNDHVNQSQSSNDTFPSAMLIATAIETHTFLFILENLRDAMKRKEDEWMGIIKIGRTHLQDATPLSLGQEFSGYTQLLTDNIQWIRESLTKLYELPLGGTAVGTGLNAPQDFDIHAIQYIATFTNLPFIPAPNKFATIGSHDALVNLSGNLKTLANTLTKIANDIRLLTCGPRCGIHELYFPQNEPGSSIMPGKVNPTQCEAMTMVAIQIIANDLAVTLGGCGGHLELNVYKPLIMYNVLHSLRLLQNSCTNFRRFLIEGLQPNRKQIEMFLNRSLMLITALTPEIGYDNACKVAQYAHDHHLTLKEAAITLGFVTAEQFDAIVDPKKMI